MNNIKTNNLNMKIRKLGITIEVTAKWLLISAVTGVFGGALGSLFVISVRNANIIRMANSWLLFLLPIGGIIIVKIYSIKGLEIKGTNRIIQKVRDEEEVPMIVAPLIFISTCITHVFGGSAGREGAAIQIGGTLGATVGKIFKLDEKDMSLVVLSGVSAVFAALFGTPVTAVFFSLEVISVGIIYYSGLIPCLTAAIVAVKVSKLFGVKKDNWHIANVPSEFDMEILLKVIVLAILCAILSIIIVLAFARFHVLMENVCCNKYVKILIGSVILIILSLIFNSGDYNGSGTYIIERALNGHAKPYAFLIKLIFTTITLGVGFKGGEIIPTFYIGATFGCTVAILLGLDPGFAAGIALVATFCGAVNSPVASIILSVELFGSAGFLYFVVACAVSYGLSGYYGLYSSQKIVYSKIRAEYINVGTKH